MVNMDRTQAWNRFSESGLVTDYLDFLKSCLDDGASENGKDENEYRRSGAEGDGYGRE